jgi:DNA repair protein RadD
VAGLRDYQQSAHDAVMNWVKKSLSPCLVEAATGAGKSHNIAEFARDMNKLSSGKVVLCIQPSAELVDQNYEKYLLTGNPASKFSASSGEISTKHPVIFGTPKTILNRISRFSGNVAAVSIDEAHEMTPTIIEIIDKLRELNPNLRVVGYSATPYRMRTGYIYAMDENGKPVPELSCVDPYFAAKVYTVPAKMLIDQGWLTEPVIGEINAEGYDTINMQLNSMGKFSKEDIDRAFHGHGRKTAAIVADVINRSANRLGVMFFASTIQHAEEILASLPPQLSGMVSSKTTKADRKRIIGSFKQRRIKYIVNVGVLTRGFDASHVDTIAILRATESVSLLQQIIGRGLRIMDGKTECLILDYAENIDRHCPDGDIFSPRIRAGYIGGDKPPMTVICPECNAENEFSARKNPEGFLHNENGYFVDLAGQVIETDLGPMPAHHGRRCMGQIKLGPIYKQCSYRWTFKLCPHCDGDNDIAARYCSHCKGEIIDPNEKLRIEFKALKRNPTMIQTDKIISMDWNRNMSQKGNNTIRVDFVTEYRRFSIWLMPDIERGQKAKDFKLWDESTSSGNSTPKTVTYKKDADTGFYRVFGYDREPDEIPQSD